MSIAGISIHALLAESDLRQATFRRLAGNFYPRSPCGERPSSPVSMGKFWRFLSTLSLRRATNTGQRRLQRDDISIHALLAESDLVDLVSIVTNKDFYPRSPCGERPGSTSLTFPGFDFYPRSPCGERLFHLGKALHAFPLFLSTLSLRRATSRLDAEY